MPSDAMIYRTPADLDVALDDCPHLPPARDVVMTTPTYFDVSYVINPHMADHVGTVNHAVAEQQWKALRATYTALDCTVHVVEGQPEMPDMVFCANQTLPYMDPDTGKRGVILSRMHAEERRAEVPHFAQFFAANDHAVHPLPDTITTSFEGMGDAIWHPRRHVLWGGYGYRTGMDAYDAISTMLDVPVLAVHLDDPDFYHLDTCFSALDIDTVLVYPGAFDDEGRALIDHVFETVIEAPEDEARSLFACNAHCPDGQHVLIQEGCTTTNERLRDAGFVPVPLDTREFLKSGGSVFCMKLMTWGAPTAA